MPKRRTVKDWADLANANIISCTGCGSVMEGEYYFDGDRTDVQDFLAWTLRVPDNMVESVARLLECGHCGNQIDRWDDFGVKPGYQVAEEVAIEKADRRWGKKLTDFGAFLEQYPMLGAASPVGRRILKEIDRFPRITIPEREWFRGRRIKTGEKYTADHLRVPDPDAAVVPVGRFNHPGQAHWYLTATQEAALREVLDEKEKIGWLQRWSVGQLSDVLDLTLEPKTFDYYESFLRDGEPDADALPDTAAAAEIPRLALAMLAGDHLNRPQDRSVGWKSAYFVPLFVMDAAKLRCFRGIRFTSVRGPGANLVIFDKGADVTAVGDPEITELKDPFTDAAIDSPF
jgi:hypothetical protein